VLKQKNKIMKKAVKGHMPIVVIKKIIAVLIWNISNPNKLVKAKTILAKLSGNTTFPLPWPSNITTLAELQTLITTADEALTDAKTRAKGTSQALKTALWQLHLALINIMGMVQLAMYDDAANAETICLGAGYNVKRESPHGPRKDTATSTEQGIVELEGAGAGPHQWQQSPDGGTTIMALDPTRGGKTSAAALSGSMQWFRNRQVLTKGQYGAWSNWIPVRVK
jgi:hypothetical protein